MQKHCNRLAFICAVFERDAGRAEQVRPIGNWGSLVNLSGVGLGRATQCISKPLGQRHVSPHRAYPVHSSSKRSMRQNRFIRHGPLESRFL